MDLENYTLGHTRRFVIVWERQFEGRRKIEEVGGADPLWLAVTDADSSFVLRNALCVPAL